MMSSTSPDRGVSDVDRLDRMSEQHSHGFSTRAVHAGYDPDPQTGAVNVPIYASSTFAQAPPSS